ncbi:MAG TPA: SDR family NAD(P)-dependent oxidoreductase [Burkholderiales bacterium]|jgi:3-oxoacyl-[acyl-carrier protein] reductase
MNQIDLKGKVAVITGGARGIGYAAAERMLASGASVMLWDVMADRLPQSQATLSANGRVETQVVDITDEDAVMAATAATVKALGKIDILVNSAGITGPNQKVWEYSSKDFHQVMEINVGGTFHCCKTVVPWMMKQDYGRIINIASIAGKDGNPNASAYSASKAAVIGLTKSLGKELAQTGIRVNAITPAAAKTEMFAQMTQQHIDFMLSKIPMNRFVQVEELAAMIAWMASEECSFTTGSVFDISGGRAVY